MIAWVIKGPDGNPVIISLKEKYAWGLLSCELDLYPSDLKHRGYHAVRVEVREVNATGQEQKVKASNGDTPCTGCNGKGYVVMGENSSYEYENYYDVCGEVVRRCPLCLGHRVIPEIKERTE